MGGYIFQRFFVSRFPREKNIEEEQRERLHIPLCGMGEST